MTDLAFAAGLMEGEGTVRINAITKRNKGALIVSCVNTDRELIDWLNDRWPGYCKPATGLRPEQRQAYVWTIAANQALAFLEAIEPYVVTTRMRERIAMARRWQALKAVPWRQRDDAWAEAHFNDYLWAAELNRRGVA